MIQLNSTEIPSLSLIFFSVEIIPLFLFIFASKVRISVPNPNFNKKKFVRITTVLMMSIGLTFLLTEINSPNSISIDNKGFFLTYPNNLKKPRTILFNQISEVRIGESAHQGIDTYPEDETIKIFTINNGTYVARMNNVKADTLNQIKILLSHSGVICEKQEFNRASNADSSKNSDFMSTHKVEILIYIFYFNQAECH